LMCCIGGSIVDEALNETYNIVIMNSANFTEHIDSVNNRFPSVIINRIYKNLTKLNILCYTAYIPSSNVTQFQDMYSEVIKVFEMVGLVYAAGSVEKLPYSPPISRLDESSNNLIRHGFCLIAYGTYQEQLHRNSHQAMGAEVPAEHIVTVFVFDSGIQSDLATFSGRMIPDPLCFAAGDCSVITPSSHTEINTSNIEELSEDRVYGAEHGTHVAGIITGLNNKVRLRDVRVLDDRGVGRVDDVIAALDHIAGTVGSGDLDSVQERVRSIINMSFSGKSSLALKHALYAVSKVFLVVAAAGDDDTYSCHTTPAESPHIIVVGATTQANMPLSWGNYGDCIDILAPGQHIMSVSATRNGDSIDEEVVLVTGSSASAAIVTGFVSTLFAALLEDSQARQLMIETLNEDDLSQFLRVAVVNNERIIEMVAHLESWAECSIGTKAHVLEMLLLTLRRIKDNLVMNDPSRPKAFNNLKRNFASFTKLKNRKKYEE